MCIGGIGFMSIIISVPIFFISRLRFAPESPLLSEAIYVREGLSWLHITTM